MAKTSSVEKNNRRRRLTAQYAEKRKRLKAIFETRKNKQIYLQADKQVEYGVVAEAMGEIRAAGIFQIGLITLPKVTP